MGEAVVPMGTTPREVLMEVAMELRVKGGSMDLDQGAFPVGLMGVMADSLMEEIMDTMLLQVMSLLE